LKDKRLYKESVPYQLRDEVSIVQIEDTFVSIRHFEMSFAGGAHPMSCTFYYNLSLKTASEIAIKDLLKDTISIRKTLLKSIKSKAEIKLEDDLSNNGFLVSDGNFYVT